MNSAKPTSLPLFFETQAIASSSTIHSAIIISLWPGSARSSIFQLPRSATLLPARPPINDFEVQLFPI